MPDLPRTMRFMSKGALPALLLVVFIPSAGAQAFYCSEPSEPYCIDAYGTFDDEYSFQSCRREMENYLDEVRRYEQCVADEVRRIANEAQSDVDRIRRDADDALERFNCKAQGNTYCY